MADENGQGGGIDWGRLLQGGTDSFLRIYSTMTQKPIAAPPSNSTMDYIFGTDLGDGGSSSIPASRAPMLSGPMLLLLGAAGVVAIVMLTRK